MDSNTVHLFITLFTLQDTHPNYLTFRNIFFRIQQTFCYTHQSDFPYYFQSKLFDCPTHERRILSLISPLPNFSCRGLNP